MSGHSKWANIKHKKAKADAARGRIFTRLGRELMVAVRHGGPDPETNFRLKMVMDKARAVNMPNDNIMRVIQRASGSQEGANLEEIVYEGYGPGGVAVMLELLTDNRNRTASEIRHLFSRHGGNLGESGCVAWMFSQKGSLVLERATLDKSIDEVMMDALEAGAEDVQEDEDTIEILTEPADFAQVEEALAKKGYQFSEAKIARIPQNTVELSRDDAARMLKLMEELEEHDDVQEIYANFDIPDEILASLEE
ncbi:MAG: YebC/PmpR family DNA-binding transcriptional regulator [Firmicutes bacterium]|jgi:YebC/PmpR family DNA-binding regulatory protein|nr:YebC/PmpR family DNA-binding transcriptional regulator [Bacillota bacterium]